MTCLEFERRKRGMNQDQLGEKILYTRHAISKLERERPDPQRVGRRLRAALEGFFGLQLEQLLEEITPHQRPN